MTLMEMAVKVVGKLETALEIYAQKARAERDNALLYRDKLELELKEKIYQMTFSQLLPEGYLGPRQTYLSNLAKHTAGVTLPPPVSGRKSWQDKKTKSQPKEHEKPLTHHMSIPTPPPDAPVEEPPKDEANP